MPRFQPLAQPETVLKDGIPIVCTHVAHGFTYQEWSDMPLVSYTLKGVVVDDKFVPVSNPETIGLSWAEYEQLLANTRESNPGDFTAVEVRLAHDAVSAGLTEQTTAAREAGTPFFARKPIDISGALE